MSTHAETVRAVKIGSRWTTITEYCHHGGSGCRSGFWCDDTKGGWGVGDTLTGALRETAAPRLYRSRQAALACAAGRCDWSTCPCPDARRDREGR